MASATPDKRITDAIDRVLDAEHDAAAAIVDAGKAAHATIESARATRRATLETARQRIVRMHERAQAQLARRLAALDADTGTAEPDAPGLAAVTAAAIERVVTLLTTDDTT